MMSEQENERLTRVGKGTPMGELLRRYWHPIAATPDLDADPVRRVRLMGETLILFRDKSGALGLVGERCPHRGVDLAYGIPETNGLRCPYHGWLFDRTGRCTEMPFDDRLNPDGKHRERMGIAGYPVEELGGLIYAYLGPLPAPLLPRWDLLVREEFDRTIEIHTLPCNWLQCMDNSADPIHFEFLHANFGNYARSKQGLPPAMKPRRHLKIAFDRFKYGMVKRRLLEGEPETADDWAVGHPILFPTTLAQGAQDAPTLQIRTPIDDTHTLHFNYRTKLRAPGQPPKPVMAMREALYDEDGNIIADSIIKQDYTAWIAQGPISNRPNEHLSAGDTGVALYRRLLQEGIDAVARGEDPIAVIRDKGENEPWIELHREAQTLKGFDSQYENAHDRVHRLALAGE